MNMWSQNRLPFLFIIDFEMNKIILELLDEIDSHQILFNFNGVSNQHTTANVTNHDHYLNVDDISKKLYGSAFAQVIQEINYGNSYLLNLTCKARIKNKVNLRSIFKAASAKYKIFVQDQFTCFSPECFIKTSEGNIFTYPMKGTINAESVNAAQSLLNDNKESAEHATIVDLMRNDLSKVAKKVRVTKFKFLEEIQSKNSSILQMSSEITGKIAPYFMENIGDLLFTLLPAGSISGAPKAKTIEIIRSVENEDRGYYTGICGIFDGQEIDSGVLIRLIEKKNNTLFYRTGGGITFQSEVNKEYKELSEKIYVPIDRNNQDLQRKSQQYQVS